MKTASWTNPVLRPTMILEVLNNWLWEQARPLKDVGRILESNFSFLLVVLLKI
jgi:hypothetical protein